MAKISPGTPGSNRSAAARVSLIGTFAVADFHQGAQSKHCNFDAVYMAAADQVPASTEKPLPRGSHPYTVRGAARTLSPPEPRRNMRRIRKRSGGSFSRRLDALCEPKVREAKLLGQRLMARDFDRQVAEFQVRVAVLNGFTALGIPETQAVG